MDWMKDLTDTERSLVELYRRAIKDLRKGVLTLRRRANKRAERRKAKEQQQ